MREDWRSAVITGDYVNVANLLVEGVEVNQRDRYGQTALMLAARHGWVEVVRLLLEYNAGLDVTAKYGLSALMLAVVNHHLDVAKELIDAGANTQLRGSGAPGFAGKTAPELAEQSGLFELADYLVRTRI